MFDLKKFIAFIGINDEFMSKFWDKAEAAGVGTPWDKFHVLAGDEKPSDAEIKIMKEIYELEIMGTPLEKIYETADKDFPKKLKEKNRKH